MFHAGGKDKQKQTLVAILRAIKMGYLSDIEVLGVARDVDQEHDIKNWVKSVVTNAEFNVRDDGEFLFVDGLDLRLTVIGIGNYEEKDFNIPSFEIKKEIEAIIADLTQRDSITMKFKTSLESLSNDAGRKLKPKDVMHVLAIAKDFDEDFMSSLYRKYIEYFLDNKRNIITKVLEYTGIGSFLKTLID